MAWISVIEKLPEDNQEVLVTGDSGYIKPNNRFFINARQDHRYRGDRWLDSTNTDLMDFGWVPEYWRPIEEVER